jgi:7-carboxy-7-deazaguanine synthase
MTVNINDVFWTVQGEGENWGRRALFVRMPFCNLSCSWCDTSFNTFKKWTEAEFKQFAQLETGRFAVLTGGEPSMNKHSPVVIKWLKDLGFEIAIESNGTFPIPEGIDFITVSPKRDADYDVHPSNWDRVDEFKYVVDEGFDFKILERHNNQHRPRLSLSPEYNNFHNSLKLITEYTKEHPRWRISLQTHKWMKVP